MTRHFNVSREASSDIRSIGRYTQKIYGAARRRIYLAGLEEKFQLLAQSPGLYPERCEFDPPVRIAHYREHLVVYTESGTGILIIRVLHNRMDVPAQLNRTSQE